MYTTSATQWHWKEWTSVINKGNSNYYINEQENILIITELCTSNVDWTTCRKITDNNWNLHINRYLPYKSYSKRTFQFAFRNHSSDEI